MKRTIAVSVLVVALVFGIAAYATAVTQNVTVTATINPAFSMTLDANSFAYGLVDVGTTPSIAGPVITVKSNKPWTYTEEAVTSTEALLLPLATDSYTASKAVGQRGVTTLDYTYDLNLATDAAYDIPAEVAMTLTYGYTAVQTP